MEITALHLSLGGLTAILGLVATVGSIWRFLIKPAIDAAKAEQEETRQWRDDADTRITLIEESLPPETQAKIKVLRERLIKNG